MPKSEPNGTILAQPHIESPCFLILESTISAWLGGTAVASQSWLQPYEWDYIYTYPAKFIKIPPLSMDIFSFFIPGTNLDRIQGQLQPVHGEAPCLASSLGDEERRFQASLWEFNIAIEDCPFLIAIKHSYVKITICFIAMLLLVILPITHGDFFNGYVKLPEGTPKISW